MNIALIGGLDRGDDRYGALAAAMGHVVERHTGNMAGRGTDTLQAMIDRADLVLVITDVNSHAAVLAARRMARARGRSCVLVRRFGLSRFRGLLQELWDGPAITQQASGIR